MAVETTIAPVLTGENASVKSVEVRRTETRSEVLDSFNRVYSAFDAAPDSTLEAIEPVWLLDGREQMRRTLADGSINFSQGKDSFRRSLKDKDGKRYQRTQYLQIDPLMDFAAAQANNSELTDQEREAFKQDVAVLERYSKSVIALIRGRDDLRPVQKARLIQEELDRIQASEALSSGNPKKDKEIAAKRIQTDIRYFIPPKEKSSTDSPGIPEEPATPAESPLWVTKNGTSDIHIPTAINGSAPWLTQTLPLTLDGLANGDGNGSSPQVRQDEAPWGKPDLPKDVEVRTSQLPEEIIKDAQARKDSAGNPPPPPPPTAEAGGTPEPDKFAELSQTMNEIRYTIVDLQQNSDPEALDKMREEFGSSLTKLVDLTGDRIAVNEFVQANFTRELMISQKTQKPGEISDKMIDDATERLDTARDKLYELAKAKSASQGLALGGENPTPSGTPEPPEERAAIPNPQRTVETPGPELSDKEKEAIRKVDYITVQYETDLNFAELNKASGDPEIAQREAEAVEKQKDMILSLIGGNQKAFDRFDTVARKRQKFDQEIEKKYGIDRTSLTFDEKAEDRAISDELGASRDELRRLAIEKANSTPDALPHRPVPESDGEGNPWTQALAGALPTEGSSEPASQADWIRALSQALPEGTGGSAEPEAIFPVERSQAVTRDLSQKLDLLEMTIGLTSALSPTEADRTPRQIESLNEMRQQLTDATGSQESVETFIKIVERINALNSADVLSEGFRAELEDLKSEKERVKAELIRLTLEKNGLSIPPEPDSERTENPLRQRLEIAKKQVELDIDSETDQYAEDIGDLANPDDPSDTSTLKRIKHSAEETKANIINLTGSEDAFDEFDASINAVLEFIKKHGSEEDIPEELQSQFQDLQNKYNQSKDKLITLAVERAHFRMAEDDLRPAIDVYDFTRDEIITATGEQIQDARARNQRAIDKLIELTGNKDAVERFERSTDAVVSALQAINPENTLLYLNGAIDEAQEAENPTPAQTQLLDAVKSEEGYLRALVNLRAEIIKKELDSEAKPVFPPPPLPFAPLPWEAPIPAEGDSPDADRRPVVAEFGPDGTVPIGYGEPGFIEPEEPSPPTPGEIRRYHITIARNDAELSERARKEAEDFLREEMKRGNIFTNFKRKVGWRMVEHGMRHHFIERIRDARLKTGLAYADVDLSRNGVVRVKAEHIDSTLRDQSATLEAIALGEGKRQLIEDTRLKQLVYDEVINPTRQKLASTGITESTFAEMQKLLGDFAKRHRKEKGISEMFGAEGSPYGETAYYFATDLIDIAQQINRDSASHEFSLDMLDISIASAKSVSEGEVKLGIADRIVRFGQTKTGGALNPAVVGGALSLALNPAIVGVNAVTRIPGVGILSGALSGSVLAAARRNYDLKMDMAAHRVDVKYGEKTPAGAKRREALQSFSYKVAPVSEILYKDREITPDSRHPAAMAADGRSMATLLDSSRTDLTNPENQQALLRRMAEIRARLDASPAIGINLLVFDTSSGTSMGRLELIRALAEAKNRLSALGSVDEFSADYRSYQSEWGREFMADRAAQDKAFRTYRWKQALRAGARGAAVGAGSALMIGETVKLANRVAQELNINFGAIISRPALASAPKPPIKTGAVSGKSAQELVFQAQRPDVKTGEKLAAMAGVADHTPKVAEHLQSIITPDTPLHTSRVFGKEVMIPDGTFWRQDQATGRFDLVSTEGRKVLLNDVYFDAKGKIHVDPKSLWADQLKTSTSSHDVVRKVMGRKGLWEELSVDPKKVRWDNNGTPGVSDGDELRLFDKRLGNGVVLKIPDSANGVFLNVDGERVWVPKSGDSHLVRLDPDSRIKIPGRTDGMTYGDVARMTIDQDELRKYHGSLQTEVYANRRKIFRVDTIEAARFKNGRATILATIRGEGHLPKEFKVGTETHTSFRVTPGEVTVEPTPTPTPTPTPPVEPTPPVIPTPEPSPTETPVPPTNGGGFSFNIPDINLPDLSAPMVTPMTPRYGLEKMQSASATTPPSRPVDTRPPSASPGFLRRREEEEARRTAPGRLDRARQGLREGQERARQVGSAAGRGFTQGVERARGSGEVARRRLENLRSEVKIKSDDNLAEKLNSQRTHAYYDAIGESLDIEFAYKPAGFKPGFINTGNTLTDRVRGHINSVLTRRIITEVIGSERTRRILNQNETAIEEFPDYLAQINQERVREGKPQFVDKDSRKEDSLYIKDPYDFAFHFRKSELKWDPAAPKTRAYITLAPSERERVHKHFVDLVTTLYDAGISFEAKAGSVMVTAERTDNMVFYIAENDRSKAAPIIRKFLSDRGIGEGGVSAALPDSQPGLSWAINPGEKEAELFRQITGGSNDRISFNMLASVMAAPTYMERLAMTNEASGDNESAETFRKEAERVRKLIAEYESSLPKPSRPKGGLTGRASQVGERLQSTVRRPEGQKPERFDYKKAYVERFTKDGEKASEDGADNYVYPPDIRQGWQLHLNLVAKSSNLLPEIYGFLKENGLFGEFKYSENPDEQGIFSIYVGNRNDSVRFARLIQERFGDRLGRVAPSMAQKDLPILGKESAIGASFDITQGQKYANMPQVDDMFMRGSQGLIYLQEDAPKTTYASTTEDDIEQALENADAEYKRVFGAFYTGSGEYRFEPNLPASSAVSPLPKASPNSTFTVPQNGLLNTITGSIFGNGVSGRLRRAIKR